jgi:hypothetical protein
MGNLPMHSGTGKLPVLQSSHQSFGAKPLRLMGLAWLSSIPLVSIFRGYFLAQSMHVVTPGSASSRAGAMGRLQSQHSFRWAFDSSAI